MMSCRSEEGVTMKVKGKIGQFFCKHKNTGWYTKSHKFKSLQGDTQYKVCKDCGKELASVSCEYEGSGYR